jgi:hypothetical protein
MRAKKPSQMSRRDPEPTRKVVLIAMVERSLEDEPDPTADKFGRIPLDRLRIPIGPAAQACPIPRRLGCRGQRERARVLSPRPRRTCRLTVDPRRNHGRERIHRLHLYRVRPGKLAESGHMTRQVRIRPAKFTAGGHAYGVSAIGGPAIDEPTVAASVYPAPEAATVRALYQLNAEWIRAFADCDDVWYSEHLNDEFVCTLADGRRVNKQDFVRHLQEQPRGRAAGCDDATSIRLTMLPSPSCTASSKCGASH